MARDFSAATTGTVPAVDFDLDAKSWRGLEMFDSRVPPAKSKNKPEKPSLRFGIHHKASPL